MKTLMWMMGIVLGFVVIRKVQREKITREIEETILPKAAHGAYEMDGEDYRYFVDGRKTDVPYPTILAWCSYCKKYQGVYLNPQRDRALQFPGEHIPRFLMYKHGQCYGGGQPVDRSEIIKDFI